MYLYVFESSLSNVFIQLHKRVFQVELIDIPSGQDDSLLSVSELSGQYFPAKNKLDLLFCIA